MTWAARHAFSVTLALAFLMGGVGDALGSHHCPHHDGVGAAGDHGAAGEHGTAGEHRTTGHHDPATEGDAHGPCTCVGRCHAGAAPSIAAPGASQAAPVADVPPLSVSEPPPPARPAIVPFSLPWGNAPPTL